MPNLKIILHPTDFTDRSRGALEVARLLARDHGAHLVLLHVASFDLVPYGAFALPVDLDALRAELCRLAQAVDGPDLKEPIAIRLAQGDVAGQILHAAREVHADAIVMGSHGQSALQRLLMGSVAEAVLRRACCPVLIVKTPLERSTALVLNHAPPMREPVPQG